MGQGHAADGILGGTGPSAWARQGFRHLSLAWIVGGRRRFPNHLSRCLVLAQPLEDRMAQGAVVGPFAERYLGDEDWLDPMRAASLRALRRVAKGALLLRDPGEAPTEARQQRFVESAPNLS